MPGRPSFLRPGSRGSEGASPADLLVPASAPQIPVTPTADAATLDARMWCAGQTGPLRAWLDAEPYEREAIRVRLFKCRSGRGRRCVVPAERHEGRCVMAVVDRWHKARPRAGEAQCREHKTVPSSVHGSGERWQVRWRDEQGEQRARNFARKTGTDPDKCADAFDAKVRTTLDDGSYIDPADANTTFNAFAEDWRKTRTHDVVTAGRIERELRLHVYPAIGHRTMKELGKRPSLMAAWISRIKLAPSSARQVIRDVSSVFIAAIDDGLMARNPLQAKSVARPKVAQRKAQPWTLDQVDAMAAAQSPVRGSALPRCWDRDAPG